MTLPDPEAGGSDRRRMPIAVVVASVLAMAAGLTRAQCEAGNLLPNCGFEVDTVGWEGNVMRTTADSRSGVASGEADAFQSALHDPVDVYDVNASSCTDLPPLSNYEISGYFKLASGESPSCGILGLFHAAPGCSGPWVGNSGAPFVVATSATWLQSHATVNAAPLARSVTLLIWCTSTSDFSVRFDDFVVDPIEPHFGDGFESGDTSAWSIVIAGGAESPGVEVRGIDQQ